MTEIILFKLFHLLMGSEKFLTEIRSSLFMANANSVVSVTLQPFVAINFCNALIEVQSAYDTTEFAPHFSALPPPKETVTRRRGHLFLRAHYATRMNYLITCLQRLFTKRSLDFSAKREFFNMETTLNVSRRYNFTSLSTEGAVHMPVHPSEVIDLVQDRTCTRTLFPAIPPIEPSRKGAEG